MMDQQTIDSLTGKTRSRSGTAASSRPRKRPQSRASTTSIHSGIVQQSLDQSVADQAWFDHGASQQRFAPLSHQMTPEDMVMHSASQLRNPRGYEIDPLLDAQNAGMSFAHDNAYNKALARHSLPEDGYITPYGDADGHILDAGSGEQDDVESLGAASDPKKKVSKASAANEKEMRQLYQSNRHRTLPDVAAELQGDERGPQSERQRQVFAMLWISQVCDKGKGSVPRGRVYSTYVNRCTKERVTVLNPASFGKLVRVLFPGLKTRRLGVRGESKYHYVNFSLIDDQPTLQNNHGINAIDGSNSFARSISIPPAARFEGDRAAFPSPDIPQIPERTIQPSEGYIRPHSLYNEPEISSLSQADSTTGKVPQRLQFAPANQNSMQDFEALSLPNIEPFLPVGTDRDSATALSALYRSHCTSLIECIRYCKEKTFWHLFTSFNGTLTAPIQKLFGNPSLALWIEECDFVMYQKMLRVIAPLTLQVVPNPVLETFRNISERLVRHIQISFQGQPSHIVNAKVAPATLFAGLLDRELRVNLTAHAAANMLSNSANRDQMYDDWISMVRTRKIAECVPTRGMDDVVNLFLTGLRDLLDPVNVPWEVESLTAYGEMALRNGPQHQARIHTDSSTENVLDRWVNFLTSLPGKFPYATHAEIVWCVQSVGTSVMRELTIAQGKSFGAWWVTKCWVDEMIAFLAEQGGFMEQKTSQTVHGEVPQRNIRGQDSGLGISGSRYSAPASEYLGGTRTTTPRPMDTTSQAAMNAAAGHDDSGIGMRTPDEDLSMAKFEFGRDESGSGMGGNELDLGSPPHHELV